MRIAVLGDGAWGSALARLLNDNRHSVSLWGAFPDYIEEMKASRTNPRFLPGCRFDEAIALTSVLEEAVADAELLVLAAPTRFVRGVLERLAALGPSRAKYLVNVAKGIETGSLKRVSEMVAEYLPGPAYAVLSGPSHAEEVIKRSPTAVVIAASTAETGDVLLKTFMNAFFRAYYSDDAIGVELGGALKNVLAIAAGMIDGMELGDNAKAALVTRGIAEMARLGKALGGRAETFSGLSGIGDLIVTCYSRHSRNRLVGERLGQGKTLSAVLDELRMAVAEGVTTAKSAKELAAEVRIETPIIDETFAVLYENKSPRACVRDLMTRSPKPEIY